MKIIFICRNGIFEGCEQTDKLRTDRRKFIVKTYENPAALRKPANLDLFTFIKK